MTVASQKVDWPALEEAATDVRRRAYAPYSRYRVGAAVLSDDGVAFVGCNVENASYGLTVCAERNAIGAMVAAGKRKIAALVVVTGGREAGSPCGMCRQVVLEFCEDAPVRLLALDENDAVVERRDVSAAALLPGKFRGERVTGG